MTRPQTKPTVKFPASKVKRRKAITAADLDSIPRCPRHGSYCTTYRSAPTDSSMIQYRRCPVDGCGYTTKTVVQLND